MDSNMDELQSSTHLDAETSVNTSGGKIHKLLFFLIWIDKLLFDAYMKLMFAFLYIF